MSQPTEPGIVSEVGTSSRLAAVFRVTAIAVFAFAVTGALAPGAAGLVFDRIAVGLVIAAPLLRVALAGVGFVRERDWRFALASAGLLAVIAVGALSA